MAELRNAWWTDEPNVLAVDGQKLGQPGDDTDMVELALIDLDATLGATSTEDRQPTLFVLVGLPLDLGLALVEQLGGVAPGAVERLGLLQLRPARLRIGCGCQHALDAGTDLGLVALVGLALGLGLP